MIDELCRAMRNREGYEASTQGRVRSLDRIVHYKCGRTHRRKGQILTPIAHSNGYRTVAIFRTKEFIHRLVALTFLGEPEPNQEVCHDDGDRTNNRLSNLRWDTRKGNMADAARHGTTGKGEKSPNAKLTAADVRAIRTSIQPTAALATVFGISKSHTKNLRAGYFW